MTFGQMLRNLAPIAALALGAGLSGCNDMNFRINGEEGVPLSELETEAAAPTELVVAANARVVVSEGEGLEIEVEGDSENALRFVLENETLGISRDRDIRSNDSRPVVRVTMPALERVVIGGSGIVEARAFSANAQIVIGGSGSVIADRIAAQALDITIGGSGKVRGSGTADELAVNVGGSGDVAMPGLRVERADIKIGGSGDVTFASDGEVIATIAGSGNVVVDGRATCSIKAFGSGKLTCREPQPEPQPEAAGALPDES